MIDPRKPKVWMESDSIDVVDDVGGRIGPGSEYHCAHGEEISVFSVLDSRVNEHLTLLVPFVGASTMLSTSYVIPSGSGTKLVTHTSHPKNTGPKDTTELPLEESAGVVRNNIGGSLERHIAQADAAAASMATS